MGFQQTAELVEQTEVHAPRVDADAVEAAGELCLEDALLDLIEQTQRVPVRCAVQIDRIVGKAVHFGQRDLVAVEDAENGAAG